MHLDSGLKAQARKLEKLTLTLKQHLPPECDGHYYVTNIHENTVVIITDSPVWTTRLRQLGPLILQSLSGHSAHPLHHVRISSRLGPVIERPTVTKVQRSLSRRSSDQIAQTASYIGDSKLKNALLKISRHRKK